MPPDNNNPNDQAPASDPLNPVPPAGGAPDDGSLPVNHDDPAASPAPDPGLGVPPAAPPEGDAPADPLGGLPPASEPPAQDDSGLPPPPAGGQDPNQAL